MDYEEGLLSGWKAPTVQARRERGLKGECVRTLIIGDPYNDNRVKTSLEQGHLK